MLLQAPARLIANNAGVEGDVIVEKLMGQPWEQGYNAMDDRIENLMEAGIIDPAKVILRFLTPASLSSIVPCPVCWSGSSCVSRQDKRVCVLRGCFMSACATHCTAAIYCLWLAGDKERLDECMRYCWHHVDNTGCDGGEEGPQVSW